MLPMAAAFASGAAFGFLVAVSFIVLVYLSDEDDKR